MRTNRIAEFESMPIPPDMTKEGFYVGLSGYYYDDWTGTFNPPKLTAKTRASASEEEVLNQDRLVFYQKYFSFVEINNTFYNEPQLPHFMSIAERSKGSMKFTVKVHKDISHGREWNSEKGCEAMRRHINAVSPLIETGRFYSFLIQLEDHLCRNQKILDYLMAVGSEAVSRHVDVHIEFRHRSWHETGVLTALKNSGIGICNTEIPPVSHAFPLKAYATSDKGYIRYDYRYSDEEINERVQGQIIVSKKATVVAVAYNNHYQAKAVRNAIKNLEILRKIFQ